MTASTVFDEQRLQKVLNTPVSKLNDFEAKLLSIVMAVKKANPDLTQLADGQVTVMVPVKDLEELCELVSIVRPHGCFDPDLLVSMLQKHQDKIYFGGATQFGFTDALTLQLAFKPGVYDESLVTNHMPIWAFWQDFTSFAKASNPDDKLYWICSGGAAKGGWRRKVSYIERIYWRDL